MKYTKGSTPQKKLPTTKVTVLLPTLWMRDVDDVGRREGHTRSAVIQTIVGDWLLKQGRASK
jgi:hypothetical protein